MEISLILAVDSRLPEKVVNPGTNFEDGGVSLWIPLLTGVGTVSFYLLVRENVHKYMCLLL